MYIYIVVAADNDPAVCVCFNCVFALIVAEGVYARKMCWGERILI